MRTWSLAILVAAGCATAPPPATVTVAPQPMSVDFEVQGPTAPDHTTGATAQVGGNPRGEEPPPRTRNQPPEVKLKLGHYIAPRLSLGLVIDRTDETVAKVRFDGTDQTIELIPQYFWHRTEYHRALTGAPNDKVIVVHHTGRVALHLEGLGDDGAYLHRDGDADPL